MATDVSVGISLPRQNAQSIDNNCRSIIQTTVYHCSRGGWEAKPYSKTQAKNPHSSWEKLGGDMLQCIFILRGPIYSYRIYGIHDEVPRNSHLNLASVRYISATFYGLRAIKRLSWILTASLCKSMLYRWCNKTRGRLNVAQVIVWITLAASSRGFKYQIIVA